MSELNEEKKRGKNFMAFSKQWKTKWELKSLDFDQLFNVLVEVITKQLDEIEKEDIKLEKNLIVDYEADSVDIVAMLLSLEDLFQNPANPTRIVVPTNKLGEVTLVEDLFDIIYETLLEMEKKVDKKLEPNFDVFQKQKKLGELYQKSSDS
jgi:acyl carrier protein